LIKRRTLLSVASAAIPAILTSRSLANTIAGPEGGEPLVTTEGYVPVLGGRLKYLMVGEGETLVLLHKLGGRIQEWRRMLPALAAHYRVIVLDLAGHGQSEMQGAPPFVVSQESMAAQVMNALDTLEVSLPYRFVGSSLGGCTAIVCAALWPERVAGVVSLGTALGGSVSRDELNASVAESIAMGQFDEEENPLPRPVEYGRRVFGLRDDEIADEQNDSRAQAGRWISPASRGVGRIDYLALLPQVTAPVLLAWGQRGSYGRYVEAALPLLVRGQAKEIEDSGSFPHEEAADTTSQLVIAFFADAS
jgi:pimeloyl-ACP methyl ester carboxylesterase